MRFISLLFTLTAFSAQGQNFLQQAFPSGATRIDLESDGIFSSDVKVIDTTFRFVQERGRHQFSVELGQTRHEIDYAPAPGTFTREEFRAEEAFSAAIGYRFDLRNDFRLNFNASYSDGFTDHRSLWIAEFYRQSFQFFPSYVEPDPDSLSFSTGFEWDFNPRNSLVATFGFSQSTIVPGYAIDPVTFVDVEIGDAILDTYSGSLRVESQVHSRVSTQQTLLLSETEGRQLRWQLRTDWALSLNEQLTLRLQAGLSRERPVFEAYYGGASLVYELTPNWQFDVGYRVYSDTGEITQSNFNASAPGIDTSEISFGALWRAGNNSLRASIALFDSDFNEITNSENLVFSNLFGDREFVAARVAFTRTF